MGILSPLTHIENEFLGITNDIVVHKSQNDGGMSKHKKSNFDSNIAALDHAAIKGKMDSTKLQVREALYKLSRCVETAEKLHTQLYVDMEGPQNFDLVAGLPNYFKLECPAGTVSPLILKVDFENERDDIVIYGSFNCKEPSGNNHQLYVRNPKKIKIFEPFGKNIFTTCQSATSASDLLTYYLTLCSHRGNQVTVTSLARIDLKAQKKSKIRAKEAAKKDEPPMLDLSDNFVSHLQAREDVQHLITSDEYKGVAPKWQYTKVSRKKMKMDIR